MIFFRTPPNDRDGIMQRLANATPIVRRCKYCRPAHRIDASGNPIPGPADNTATDVRFSDGGYCPKWKEDLTSKWLASPVDPKDPACAWFYEIPLT